MTATVEPTARAREPKRPEQSPIEATLRAVLERQRAAGLGLRPPELRERREALKKLERVLLDHDQRICEAISADFGNRSHHETRLAEIFVSVEAIRFTLSHLADWMAPERRRTGWAFLPASSWVEYQPLGVVGIISPWNYPLQLSILPLIGALAAGNRAMIKPSELGPRFAELLASMLGKIFPPEQVAVVTGGPEVGEAFSRLPFDHLVFTGSTRVGKLVMRAAAENLVPVTLELGGKSPVIVGDDFPVAEAAARITMGKLLNAGQTCIAPDYVLVPEAARGALVEAVRASVAKSYPRLGDNPDYTSIINDAHYCRLVSHLDDARAKGATLIELNPAGETLDPSARKLAPVLVLNPTEEMSVMQEELFGPILPIQTYRSLDEAIRYVNTHPRPLALYYFGHRRRDTDRVLKETIAGGVGINETMLHVVQDDLPFGGVGPSGMGHYHAFEGFESFSKKKAVFRQSRINAVGLLRPPFGKLIDGFLKIVLR